MEQLKSPQEQEQECLIKDFNFTDCQSVKNDPRYKNLCRNKRKTVVFQPFSCLPDPQDKLHQKLSELLEFDFERRTPLRRSNSIVDFAKAFSEPMSMFRKS